VATFCSLNANNLNANIKLNSLKIVIQSIDLDMNICWIADVTTIWPADNIRHDIFVQGLK